MSRSAACLRASTRASLARSQRKLSTGIPGKTMNDGPHGEVFGARQCQPSPGTEGGTSHGERRGRHADR
jgi:hypothetical protein